MTSSDFDAAPRIPSARPQPDGGMRGPPCGGGQPGPPTVSGSGVSTIEPGGGTTLDASGLEKMYVVLDGEVTISNGHEEAVAAPMGLVHVRHHRTRGGPSRTTPTRPATILLAMPLQSGKGVTTERSTKGGTYAPSWFS